MLYSQAPPCTLESFLGLKLRYDGLPFLPALGHGLSKLENRAVLATFPTGLYLHLGYRPSPFPLSLQDHRENQYLLCLRVTDTQ